MPSNHWLKLWHEMLHDPKIGRLPDRLYRRFVECLLMAGEGGTERGDLPDIEDMAWTLHADELDLESELFALAKAGLLTQDDDGAYYVTKFAARQAAMEPAERMRRYRDDMKRRAYYGDDTQRNDASDAPVTNRNTDTDTDTDTDTEADTDSAPIGAGAEAIPFSDDLEPEEEPEPIAEPVQAATKPKRASRPRDPRSSHPAIQAVQHVAERYPPKGSYDLLITAIGEQPDVGKLKACYAAWSAKGYNPNNLAWALDWYREGIPKANGNGARASPQAGVLQRADDEIRQWLAGREAGNGDRQGDS